MPRVAGASTPPGHEELGPRALVIDDDGSVLKAHARVLARSGYRVDTASGAASGLDALRRGPFDVVVSDIKMPGMSGIELVERMRADGIDVPVVLVTGVPQVATAAKAVELGVVRYLSKPMDLAELARAVDEAVRLQGIARARRLALDNEALRSLVEELRRSKDAAQAGKVAKKVFLSTIKHELRTPMTVVLGMTEVVLGSSDLTEELRSQIEVVKTAADALMALIADLLDLASLDHGNVELEAKGFAVRDAIQEVLERFAAAAGAKGMSLEAEVTPDVPDVLVGDLSRFQQVLRCVLANAVKFGREGKVCVRASLLPDRGDNACLRLAVRDPGIGIPPDRVAHVLQAFTQDDDSSSRSYAGAGLGLAIASQLVALMGGTLEIDSTPGVGTEVAFTACFDLPGVESQGFFIG